jgi:hypothetical protein
MRVYKFLCTPASADDDRCLREQVALGARYRRQIALIDNRERFLRRALADYPARNVPMDDRGAWWKSENGKAASAAWHDSDEFKALRTRVFAEKKRALKATRDAAIGAGAMWGTLGKADDAADFARRTIDKVGLIDKDGKTTYVSSNFPPDVGRVAVQFQRQNARIDARTGKELPAKKSVYADEFIGGQGSWLRIGSVAYALGTPIDRFRPAALDGDGNAIDVVGNPGDIIKIGPRAGETAKKGKRFHSLAIRVGTVPGTIRPIWTHLHLLLHQSPRTKNRLQLGHDVVKWAVIRRERTGLRYRWYLTLEVESDVAVMAPHPHPHDAIAVHIGWRQLYDEEGAKAGIRVLTWSSSAPLVADDPASPCRGQLVIPEDVLGKKPFADRIHSTRDLNQDVLRDMILVYARSLPPTSWLRIESQHMHNWRAPRKYVRLLNQWREQRIHGDQAAFAALEAWSKQDRHLLHRELPSLERMQRQVEGRVTALAVQLVKRYGVVACDDFDVTNLVEKDDQHDEDEQRLRKKNARRVNVLGPGRARALVGYFAKKYGCVDLKVDAAGGTLDCDSCGHRRDVSREDRVQRMLHCENCGHSEDQDVTMSRNLLAGASAIARGESGWPLAPKVPGPSGKKRVAVRRNRRRDQQPLAPSVVTP